MSAAAVELDFVKALADSWDGRGNNVFTVSEQRALWMLGYLDHSRIPMPHEEYRPVPRWSELSGDDRRRLVAAARAAIELGSVCQAVLA